MYEGEVITEKKKCVICGDTITIEKTEEGQLLGRQYQGTREKPKHIECARLRALENNRLM